MAPKNVIFCFCRSSFCCNNGRLEAKNVAVYVLR